MGHPRHAGVTIQKGVDLAQIADTELLDFRRSVAPYAHRVAQKLYQRGGIEADEA